MEETLESWEYTFATFLHINNLEENYARFPWDRGGWL